MFALAFLLTLGVKALVGPVKNDNSNLHHYTGLIGTTASGTFLVVIAAINIIILVGILKVFRDMRQGVYDEETLEDHLDNRGLMNRILRPIMKSITRPGQMYPVGMLFGLGFDTATEVALLVVASAGAAGGLPWYAILSLPILKVFYNITITSLSIIVAVFIGGLEVLHVMSGQLNLTGGLWAYANNFDLNKAGFVIAGLFVATWVIALSVWRFAHIEEKWSAGIRTSESPRVAPAAATE